MDADFGVIGLAVMGENIALNIRDRGYKVAVFNRSPEKTRLLAEDTSKNNNLVPSYSLEDFVKSLARPRKILLMVKAGQPVDDFIAHLLPLLEKGDIIIDGGNSFYKDTERRMEALAEEGILYLGVGISGGEEGARHGPSMMVGGSQEAWPIVKPIFQACAAQAYSIPCADWVGSGGAGHFVKMVHNGIEYGDMELIAEVYQYLKLHGLENGELSTLFADWNKGVLGSYLIEITAAILKKRDEKGSFLVDDILDKAEQKGTGKWTSEAALDYQIPLTLITESVFARILSSMKETRVALSKKYPRTTLKKEIVDKSEVESALYVAKILSYTQGLMLIQKASSLNNWDISLSKVAHLWRGGCIIRSVFLNDIAEIYEKNSQLGSLLEAPFFENAIKERIGAFRAFVSKAVSLAIPVPAFAAGLTFFDGITEENSAANLIQAQRDFFGAHTFQKKSDPSLKYYHALWTS